MPVDDFAVVSHTEALTEIAADSEAVLNCSDTPLHPPLYISEEADDLFIAMSYFACLSSSGNICIEIML